MECRDVDRLMDAYLDRDVGAEEAGRVQAHLAACRRCRREHGGLIELLRSPEPVEVPPGLKDRILEAMDARYGCPAGRPRRTAGRPGRRWMAAPWWGAVAASLLFFVMGWLSSQWWQGPDRLPPIPTPNPKVEPVTIVLSPWMLSSWAQAATMPGPAAPVAMLVNGIATESLLEAPVEVCPAIRIYDRSRQELVPVPPDTDAPPPEIPLLPLVPRYLGA